MEDRRVIGAHEVWLEGDLVCIRYHGATTKAEMLAIFAFLDAAIARYGTVYLMVDSNDAVLPSVEARRVIAEHGYANVTGFVRYQRSPATNSWLTLLLQNAIRLIGRSTTRTGVVASEAE